MSRCSSDNVLGGIRSPSGVRKPSRRSGAFLQLGIEAADTEPGQCFFDSVDDPTLLSDEALAHRRARRVMSDWSDEETDEPLLADHRNFYKVEKWNHLLERGVEVGEIWHKVPIDAWNGGFASGLDSARRDYASFADFSDPDGNSWVLQERGYRNA